MSLLTRCVLTRSLPVTRSTPCLTTSLQLRSPPSCNHVLLRRTPAIHSRTFTSNDELNKPSEKSRWPSLRTGYNAMKGVVDRISSAGSALSSFQSGLLSATGAVTSGYSRCAQTSYGRLMRLDKPIGTHLLFLPGAWAISIASTSPTEFLKLTGLFYAGAVLMRGAGCTINDIWDVDVDRKVERTKSRPIAAGEISTPAAFTFLGAQLSGALLVLTRLNTESFIVATMAVLPVLFYPMAKRHTAYPQAALGLTFNWGALLGYTAATGTIGAPALWLYGAGWCWTMVYDTIYAFQDRADDERIGVQSTARTFGEYTKPVLAVLTAGKFAFLTGAGLSADLSMPYFIGTSAATAHLAYQVYATDLSDPSQCLKAFTNGSTTGAITWASIIAGRMF